MLIDVGVLCACVYVCRAEQELCIFSCEYWVEFAGSSLRGHRFWWQQHTLLSSGAS